MITKDPPMETTRLINNNEAIAEAAGEEVFESVITDSDGPNDNDDIRWLREQRLLHQSLTWYNKPSLILLAFPLLLNFLSMGVSISSKVMLLLGVICKDLMGKNPSIDNCHDSIIQSELSSLTSISTFSAAIVVCLVSGKLGELSDRFGRKPILIYSGITSLLGKSFTTFLLMNNHSYHKKWIIFASILEYLGGGVPVIMATSNSYITDIVEPEKRIVSMGFIVGTLYCGLAIGPILGNLIVNFIGEGSPIYALYFECLLVAIFVIILILFIHESRPIKLRRKSQSVHLIRKASFSSIHSEHSISRYHQFQLWRITDIFKPLKILWIPFHAEQGFKPRYNILILLAGHSVLTLAGSGLVNCIVLYSTYKFNWITQDIGYYISIIGFSKSIVLYGLTPIITHGLKKYFQAKQHSVDTIDRILITIALICDAIGPLTIILATSGSTIYASAIFASLAAMGSPTIQSTIVKYIPENKTGELFGAIALIDGILTTFGPPFFLQIYSKTVGIHPTIVFWIVFSLFLSYIFLIPFLKSHPESIENESCAGTINAGQNGQVVEYSAINADADLEANRSLFKNGRKLSIESPRR